MSGRLQGAFVRTGIVGFGVAVAAMVVLTGCSSGTTGGGGSTTSSAATTTASGNGAPAVTNPLDLSKFASNPCGTLTSAQLSTLGATGQGKQSVFGDPTTHATLGADCTWKQGNSLFGVYLGTAQPTGLGYYYTNGGTPQRLPDVDGRPAIETASKPDIGLCQIMVGASSSTFYGAEAVSIPEGTDPCTVVQQVLSAMTATIKSGS